MKAVLPKRAKRVRESWYRDSRDELNTAFGKACEAQKAYLCNPCPGTLERVRQSRRDKKAAVRKAKTAFNVKWGDKVESEENSRARAEAIQTLLGEGSGCTSSGATLPPETFADHFSKLFSKQSEDQVLPDLSDIDLSERIPEGPPTEAEVDKAIKSLKGNKASGLDGLPPEAFKAGGTGLVSRLTKDFAEFWPAADSDDQEVRIPRSWQNAELVPLFKNKGSRSDPGNYRGIFLLEIAGKVLAKVIVRRLEVGLEQVLSDTQCGFRPRRSTAHMIFILRQLQASAHINRTPLAAAFIDLKKAFDSPPREAIWQCLRAIGCPKDLLAVICAMHDAPEASVRGSDVVFKILRGVRQGCVLGPALFGLLFEFILRLSGLEEELGLLCRISRRGEGIVEGAPGNADTFRPCHGEFADDGAIVGEPEKISAALERLQKVGGAIGLDISVPKTEWLWLQPPNESSYKFANDTTRVMLNGEPIKHVESFKYLGSTISETGGLENEITARIGSARKVLLSLSKVWANPRISLHRKVRLVRTKVYSTLYYACETWATCQRDVARLEAFTNEIRLAILCLKRFRDGIVLPNEVLLQKCKLSPVRELLATRRISFYSQVVGNPSCELTRLMVFAEAVDGKCVSGRLRKIWSNLPARDVQYLTGASKIDESVTSILDSLVMLRSAQNGKAKCRERIGAMAKQNRGFNSKVRLVSVREKPEACHLCEGTFAEKKALYRHLRRDHDTTPAELAAEALSCKTSTRVLRTGSRGDRQPSHGQPVSQPSGQPTDRSNDRLVSQPDSQPTGQPSGLIPQDGVHGPSIGDPNAGEPLLELPRESDGPPFNCPAARCLMTYKRYGFLERHVKAKHVANFVSGRSGGVERTLERDVGASTPVTVPIARDPNEHSVDRAMRRPLTSVKGPPPESPGSGPLPPPEAWVEGMSACPYRGCRAGLGKTWGRKSWLNHGGKFHQWNFATHKPSRVRRRKIAPPVVVRVASNSNPGGGVGGIRVNS